MSVLVLFDVDGTLVLSGGTAREAMVRAAVDLFGHGLDWDGVNPAGGLDPLLFEEAARASGIAVSPREHARFRERYIGHLRALLEERPERVRVLPGVRALLETLRRGRGVVLGLLTGNYGPSAALKLAAGGLEPEWFRVAVFGDEGPARPALLPLALERYRQACGERLDPRRAVVVGDTPRDVHCALAGGACPFGVATGSFTAEELLAAGAERAVRDLSDPGPLLELLESIRAAGEADVG